MTAESEHWREMVAPPLGRAEHSGDPSLIQWVEVMARDIQAVRFNQALGIS